VAGSFLPPVIVELIADAKKFNAGTAQAVGGLKKLEDAGASTSARLGHVGQKVASGIIAGGVALAAVSVKMATDFEGSMTRLVTGAGEAQKNIKMIHDGILELGGQVGKTPKELADGMYYIGSAGFHGSEGLKVLKAAAEGAAVGGADMMVVADGLTTALTNYGLGADKATGVTSGLIRAVSLGKTTLPEFSGALGKVLPIAANMGISLSEATAALSTMTASGMKADVAAESLRAMMTALISPTQEGAKVLSMIGLNGQKVSDMIRNPRIGLHGTLQTIGDLLGKKLPGQTALQEQAFQTLTGGITGTSSRLLITGQHFKTFVGNIDAVTTSINGAKGEVLGFNKTQETMQQKLAELKGAGSSILVGIGEALLPTAKNLADWAIGAIAFFKKHPLISEIAKDSALTAFGLAIAAKIKAGVQGLANLFGFGKAAAQLAATTANTAALNANTIAQGGTAPTKKPSIIPRAVTTLTGLVLKNAPKVATLGEGLGLGLAVTAAEATPLPGSTYGGLTMKKLRQVYSGGPKAVNKFLSLIGGEKNLKDYQISDDNQNIRARSISQIHNGIYRVDSDTGGRTLGVMKSTYKNGKETSTKYVTIKVVG